jgi:hypothetical protein
VQDIQIIDSNKDRQEAAIYAFAIVTIIFLPLSFMSSFFWYDHDRYPRHGEITWIFWATVLPLTFIIVTVSLIWAGELGNLWNGLRELLFRQRDRSRYTELPDPLCWPHSY